MEQLPGQGQWQVAELPGLDGTQKEGMEGEGVSEMDHPLQLVGGRAGRGGE